MLSGCIVKKEKLFNNSCLTIQHIAEKGNLAKPQWPCQLLFLILLQIQHLQVVVDSQALNAQRDLLSYFPYSQKLNYRYCSVILEEITHITADQFFQEKYNYSEKQSSTSRCDLAPSQLQPTNLGSPCCHLDKQKNTTDISANCRVLTTF